MSVFDRVKDMTGMRKILKKCRKYLEHQETIHGSGLTPPFFWSLDTRELVLSYPGRRVHCDMHVVGTLNPTNRSWMFSFNHPQIGEDPEVTRLVKKAMVWFDSKNDMKKSWTPDAYDFVSITMVVNNCLGHRVFQVYPADRKAKASDPYMFVVWTKVTKVVAHDVDELAIALASSAPQTKQKKAAT